MNFHEFLCLGYRFSPHYSTPLVREFLFMRDEQISAPFSMFEPVFADTRTFLSQTLRHSRRLSCRRFPNLLECAEGHGITKRSGRKPLHGSIIILVVALLLYLA